MSNKMMERFVVVCVALLVFALLAAALSGCTPSRDEQIMDCVKESMSAYVRHGYSIEPDGEIGDYAWLVEKAFELCEQDYNAGKL